MRILPVIAILGLSALGAAPARAGNPNLAVLNIGLKDIPSGFTKAAAWTKNDAQFAANTNRTAAQLEKAGRLLTNNSSFQRTATSGIFLIGSEIAYYKSPATALADYRLDISHATPPTGYTITTMSASKVGQNRIAYQLTGLSDGVPISAESVLFQRGKYLVVIQISGEQSTYDPGDALTLARTVDARLTKQTG